MYAIAHIVFGYDLTGTYRSNDPVWQAVQAAIRKSPETILVDGDGDPVTNDDGDPFNETELEFLTSKDGSRELMSILEDAQPEWLWTTYHGAADDTICGICTEIGSFDETENLTFEDLTKRGELKDEHKKDLFAILSKYSALGFELSTRDIKPEVRIIWGSS